ncbi:hypothetical protein U0070_003138, partial [Myodes glareolus]
MTQKLSSTPARELDKFIEDHLLPDTTFRTEVRAAINTICAFLKERCFQGAAHPVRVSKVVKGGSSGKGTALKGRSDADLVVFLNNFSSFQDQLNRRGEFIREIQKQLCALQREGRIRVKFEVQSSCVPNPRALSFTLTSSRPQQEVEFDVLPAYDVLGQSLSASCCKEKLGKPLPPQYALELLTVYAWECGSGDTEFNTDQGFRTVLELVTKYRQLRIYWIEYYDFQDKEIFNYVHRQLTRARPVILDPADPTGNVAGSNSEGWRRLAEEAAAWLRYPCFKRGDDSLVGSWDVP